jgi:hypothetical protein
MEAGLQPYLKPSRSRPFMHGFMAESASPGSEETDVMTHQTLRRDLRCTALQSAADRIGDAFTTLSVRLPAPSWFAICANFLLAQT